MPRYLDWTIQFDSALAEWIGTQSCNLLTRSVALIPETLRLRAGARSSLTSKKDADIAVALSALGAHGARSAAGCLALLRNGLTSSVIPLARVLAEVELHIELIEADNSGTYAARWLEYPPSRIRHLFAKRSPDNALNYRYLSKFSHADSSLVCELHETLERNAGAWSLLEEGPERDQLALLVSIYAARISKLMLCSGVRALDIMVDHAEANAEDLSMRELAEIKELSAPVRVILRELMDTFNQIHEFARSSFSPADIAAAGALFAGTSDEAPRH